MKVFFVSLGCDKNKVDSEKILKLFLSKTNAIVVSDPKDCDVAIVNTCSFIRDAKVESKDWITYFLGLKKKGIIKKILVTGCLATEIKKEKSSILENEIDCILPLDRYLDGLNNVNDRVLDILSFSSFIKICDGCDKFCSYCIIPYLRGRFRSNSEENILKEVRFLAKNGVKELNVVGQDVLSYGKDQGKKKIVELLEKISAVDGIEWIRLMYCYPEEIDDSIINLIRDNKKILPYLDMPIQHASNKILKLMNRKSTKENIREIISKLRNSIPDICIRTTLLVGFPGESEEDFKELCDFVRETRFDKLGVFAYSREKLSKSYDLPGQIDEKTKEKRKKIILDIQKEIVKEKNNEKLGKVYYSIVEGFDTKRKKYIVRPYFNARGIDDKVFVKTKEKLISGTFINVEIKKALGFDLEGVLL